MIRDRVDHEDRTTARRNATVCVAWVVPPSLMSPTTNLKLWPFPDRRRPLHCLAHLNP